MKTSVIVKSVRTPIGKFGGSLSKFKPYQLGALVLRECAARASINPDTIDEVIAGNIMQTEPRGNPAREALLEAEYPQEIPAYTINKNCGSSLKAMHLADLMIKTGEADVVMTMGMEVMSGAPYLLRNARFGYRMGDGVLSDFLTDSLTGMGLTAERLAEKYDISREEQDFFALQSQKKAAEAQKNGFFEKEIVPVDVPEKKPFVFREDEGLKPETTQEKLSKLLPAFKKGGTVTPGNSSTLNDCAAAVLIMEEQKAQSMGCQPLARIVSFASAGVDPQIMGIGPVPATKAALKKAGLTLNDIDLIELNEAFAAQSIAVIKELNIDPSNVNINGGAIALGHPVGATGAVIVTKLLNQLKRENKKYGLATMCIGGGQGVAIILENLMES